MVLAVFPDLSSAAARRELEQYHDRIVAVIREAVRKYNRIDPSTLFVLSRRPRSKAVGLWAFIMWEVEATLRDLPGLKLVERFDTLELHVGMNLVARIKKMKPNGFTSNYRTARVADFHTAEQGELFVASQGELFSHTWAKPLCVDIGYILDETGMEVADVMVARRVTPERVHWTYSMLPPADVTPLPVAPVVPIRPRSDEARVVARNTQPSTEKEAAQGTDNA